MENQLAHTLNGSSLALPRVLAGILENYQTAEGIVIPVLPYCGFDIIDYYTFLLTTNSQFSSS
jgi:seryl-tRNA synthetase